MMTMLYAVLSLLFVLLLLFMTLYVTWLFISRLRAGKPKAKSFGRWLRDLWDAVSGLG
jgi:hypothetical protein